MSTSTDFFLLYWGQEGSAQPGSLPAELEGPFGVAGFTTVPEDDVLIADLPRGDAPGLHVAVDAAG